MSPETDPKSATRLAEEITKIWNGLATQHGWPGILTCESVRRNRRGLAGAMRGLDRTARIPHGRSESTLLHWVLSRWNWAKSPAPLALASNASQWDALCQSLHREVEETAATDKERIQSVTRWVEKERNIRRRNGMDEAAAKTEIEEFAKATGKINAWTRPEQEHFYQEINNPCR